MICTCSYKISESSMEFLKYLKFLFVLLGCRVHPVLVNSVSDHLHEVMNAVKRQDCSQFQCPSTTITHHTI